ncbi:MAG: hypothetical protein V2A61_06210 [Calditrichota bacterium]
MFLVTCLLLILSGLSIHADGESIGPPSGLIEKRIHRGVFLDPIQFYWWNGWADAKGHEAWRNSSWPDSSLFYPQLQAMGVDFTFAGHDWNMFSSPQVPDHNRCLGGLHIISTASKVRGLPTTPHNEDFSVQNALTPIHVDDGFWRSAKEDWKWGTEAEEDYFQFVVNPTGRVCEPVFAETGEIEYYSALTLEHNAGYIFQNQVINSQVNYYAYPYTFQLEVRLDEDRRKLPFDTEILRFSVDDPRLQKKGEPANFFITAEEFKDSGKWQWFTFRVDEFLTARGKTQLSLLWYGQADISVRNLRMFDCYWERLFGEEEDSLSKERYWEAVKNEFTSQEDYFQPTGRLWGFFVDEPRRIAWEGFSQMRKKIQSWRRDPALELLAVSAGLSEEALPVFINNTQVPLLIYDIYPLTPRVKHSSSGESSLQTAWNTLICNPNRNSNDYFYRGGLRAASKAAKAQGIDWWFMMQTYGSLTQQDKGWIQNTREPTREEILCQGWLGLAYGAKGFVYYHYSPCYYYGYREPADINLPAWNGAVSRGLTDLWPDAANPSDSLIKNDSEFKTAVQNRGWLHPNYKWFAVREFNRRLDQMEEFVPDLEWISAGCLADSESVIGGLEIDEVKNRKGRADKKRDRFVEVGVFNLPGYDKVYALVNRRCEPQEERTLHGMIQGGNYVFVDLMTGKELKPARGGKGYSAFYLTLPPGEGAFIGMRK